MLMVVTGALITGLQVKGNEVEGFLVKDCVGGITEGAVVVEILCGIIVELEDKGRIVIERAVGNEDAKVRVGSLLW